MIISTGIMIMTITTYLRLQIVTYRHKARSHEDRLVLLGIIGKGWGLRTEEGNKGKESSEGAERRMFAAVDGQSGSVQAASPAGLSTRLYQSTSHPLVQPQS